MMEYIVKLTTAHLLLIKCILTVQFNTCNMVIYCIFCIHILVPTTAILIDTFFMNEARNFFSWTQINRNLPYFWELRKLNVIGNTAHKNKCYQKFYY